MCRYPQSFHIPVLHSVFLKLQMQYIHVIVASKHIFFYHVYQVETIRIRLSNSCESDFAKACYLKHILIQEIHALFHKIYKAGVSEDRITVLITPAVNEGGHTDDGKEKILWDAKRLYVLS